MIDPTRLVDKGSGYAIAQSQAVTDHILMDVAVQYQNQLSQKFTTVQPAEIAKRFAGGETVLETTKYDGEGVFIYFEADREREIFAFNAPSGRVRVGLAALADAAAKLTAAGVKKGLFRAELYLPGQFDGRRHSIADVLRVSFNGTTDDLAKLRLAVFDCVMLDGRDMRTAGDFTATWETLATLFGTDAASGTHRAEGSLRPESELDAVFTEKTGAGHEGLVVRRLTRLELHKLKPQLSVDAAIVGFVEGDFEGSYGVLSLLTALTYGTGKPTHFHVIARVGSGFSDELRQQLLQLLQPLRVPAPLTMTDSDGRTIHFVKPQLVCEILGHDVISASRQDRENTAQLLVWGGKAWTFAGMAAFPRLLFPVFSKLRPDKEVGTGGARATQLLPHATEPPAALATGQRAHRVLRREVWTKESKGETMVRKLLVAEVTGDPDGFPFVVTWTDFSAKRKEPLKVDTAWANTAGRAETLADVFVADGIAKGWEKRGS